ncbi:hypothetical protein BGZ63DRAFT_247810 [Mariannaea sp. PMI_226]|nr:hypothetical protein BGZ63DRAFT_247810 [Mariannaea sp. PMI_226]
MVTSSSSPAVKASAEETSLLAVTPSPIDQEVPCIESLSLLVKPDSSPGESKQSDLKDGHSAPGEPESSEADSLAPAVEYTELSDLLWVSLQHEDHWDRIQKNPRLEIDIYDWMNEAYEIPFTDWTNSQLHAQQFTQEWLQKYSNLRLDMLPDLDAVEFPDAENYFDDEDGEDDEDEEEVWRIPLFEDKIGNQYQINLGHGTCLNAISCPKVRKPKEFNSTIIFRLRSRLPVSQAPQANTFPGLVMSLGRLVISTPDTRRFHPYVVGKVGRVIDITNYEVLVDLENKDLPLWIVAPRRFLGRYGWGWPIVDEYDYLQIPIFDGLLVDDDEHKVGYDTACIMSSIHNLRPELPDSQKASYEEACKLVRDTRSYIDAAAGLIPRSLVKELGSRQADGSKSSEKLAQEETRSDLREEKGDGDKTSTMVDKSTESDA